MMRTDVAGYPVRVSLVTTLIAAAVVMAMALSFVPFAMAATAPSITSGPAEGSTVTTNSVTFTFDAPGAVDIRCAFGGAPYGCGSPQTFSALGDSMYTFAVAAQDGLGEWATTTRTFTVDTSGTASIIITASAGANGSITPLGAVSVSVGGDQSFIITPNTDYAITDVLVDGISIGTTTGFTFSSVGAPHTISASFFLLPTTTPPTPPAPPEPPAPPAPPAPTSTDSGSPAPVVIGGGGIVGANFGVVEPAALPANITTVPPAAVPVSTTSTGQVLGAFTGGTGGAYTFSRNLRMGSRGEDVSEFQKLMIAEAVYQGPVTGYFGPMTLAGAKKLQAKYSLPSTGFVGPMTRERLNAQ